MQLAFTSSGQPTRRKEMRGPLFAVTLIVLALGLAACGDDDQSTTTRESGGPAKAGGGVAGAIPSVVAIDEQEATVTLPLHKGTTTDSQDVYYIVADSSDQGDAKERGVNFAPKLANALGTAAVQEGREEDGEIVFEGTVDFSPELRLEPSKDGFPPDVAKPGAVGDARYSPLVTTDGETVINASQVANDSGMHDSVVDLDLDAMEVTMAALPGFVGGSDNLYLRTEGSIELVAAAESSTYAPNLNEAPGLASDAEDSARSAIIPIVNGLREADDPKQRQGLQSALLGEGPPLNIEQNPNGSSPLYSPLWDITPAVWTEQAIERDQRKLLTSADEVVSEVESGRIESGGEGPENGSLGGLRALEAISNCSIMQLG
jgi:hypothetical protein